MLLLLLSRLLQNIKCFWEALTYKYNLYYNLQQEQHTHKLSLGLVKLPLLLPLPLVVRRKQLAAASASWPASAFLAPTLLTVRRLAVNIVASRL